MCIGIQGNGLGGPGQTARLLDERVVTVRDSSLTPGLYLVATPIGNAEDITLRALNVLARVDCLVAEDTRTARRLMTLHGIERGRRPMLSYHEHSSASQRRRVVKHLDTGRSVALIAEAGTPLVSDPGYGLVRMVVAKGHRIIPVPGASSVLTALIASSLPPDRFLFAGFLPVRGQARQRELQRLLAVPATLVILESPRRLTGTLEDMIGVFGPDHTIAVCRELTKRHEDIRRGPLAEIRAHYAAQPPRGECVLVVGGRRPSRPEPDAVGPLLVAALQDASLRDAVRDVAASTGLDRRTVYQMALALKDEQATDQGR